MKILVVAGANPIFEALARGFCDQVDATHRVELFTEATSPNLPGLLRDRVRRSGLLRGLDQLAFKLFDMLILRRGHERSARAAVRGRERPRPCPALDSAEGLEFVAAAAPDIVVCIATSIIPARVLATAKHGFINVHPGVLPAYRGTGNLWAVVNRDWGNVGVSVHWMTPKIDVGKLIAVERIRTPPADLWSLHVESIAKGLAVLAGLLNRDLLLSTSVDTSGQAARYYGWYGFADYVRFLRALKRWPRP